ncbi:MAG TPA: phosphotransferase [Ornithinibacter sp.]|nr:phosphotransferase [Ornithinibacter sp.]
MTRTVTLALVDADGVLLGALPPYPVSVPYWMETPDVVAEAVRLYGVTVDVLRLLTAEQPMPHGGAVTYLAEMAPGGGTAPLPLTPVTDDVAALALDDEPLRLPYARLGGPAASVGWARSVLGADYAATQERTWNLSAIWRLDAPGSTVWLKQVPGFFAHEAAVLAWAWAAVPGATPRLLAAGADGRMLLEHVDGGDLYDAAAPVRERIAETAHRIQLASVGDIEDLVVAGVPDRRGDRLVEWVRESLAPHAVGHRAEAVLDSLGRRMAAVGECGLPAALVHGDQHPGNAIGSVDRTVIIDWGDSFVGNPGFDALRIGVGLDAPDADRLVRAWVRRWEVAAPGSRPARAVELLRPVECLRLAAVYASFVAHTEPTERPYHAADITDWLDRAVEASAVSSGHDSGHE